MLSTKLTAFAVFAVLVGCYCQHAPTDDDTTDKISSGEEKDSFVPSSFVAPVLSSDVHLFDCFASNDVIGKTWIPSTAKKDGVEADISKYNVHITPYNRYEVKYEEGQECGGGYLKLLSQGAEKDLSSVQDKTPYTIMFGPDKCGASGKVHLIFRYKNPKNGSIDVGEYHAKQPSNVDSSYWDDHNTHLYTLVVKSDGFFLCLLIRNSFFTVTCLTIIVIKLKDLVPALQPPKDIADPEDKKPADWDDRAEIEEESAVKPDDWDESQPKEIVDENAVKPSDWLEDEVCIEIISSFLNLILYSFQPELIPDPEAAKPIDWDNDMDGDWEPPMIDNPVCKGISGCGQWKRPLMPNPNYKGKWVRPKIANPAYKGVWTPRQIANPHFFVPNAYDGLAPISAIGIELWTMSQNIIFDNILVADSEEIASDIAQQTFRVRRKEEARLTASKGEGGGIVQGIINAANERPWLWAVYVLCVLIPVILIGVCCFGRKSSSDTSHRKKTDAFQADDKELHRTGDLDISKKDPTEDAPLSNDSAKTPNQIPKSMKDIEPFKKKVQDDEGNGDPEELIEEVSASKKSPTITKRKVRRQD
uniref:Calreticulin family protein n=1 Tax=Heterorhabditis bacteriophora TaxID=37862 RepID=A0A1I7X8R0_HETBA